MKNRGIISKLLLATIMTIFSVNSQTVVPKEILIQCAQTLKSSQTFTYEATYKFKFFDQDSIITSPIYKCEIIKASQDTILGYYARLSNDNEERIYDGKNFSVIWHKIKEIHKDVPSVNGKKFTTNNIKKENIPIFLYAEKPFNNFINNGFNWKLSDTIIDKNEAWKIELQLPPNEEITYIKKIIYIGKESQLPLKIQSFAKFKDIQNEYLELTLSNYKLNTLQNENIKTDKLLQNYKVIDFIPFENKKNTVLKNFQITEIKTTDTKGKEKVLNLKNDENNIVILDFWYFGCAPCLKAMPKLNDLYNKYKKKGVTVYGLNPFDNSPKKIETINKFRSKSPIQYPLLFIEKELANEYNINTYPTLILLKNGQSIHTLIGHSEEDFKTLESIIETHIKTN